MPEAALYLVGTPIGNLDDFAPRGVETLSGVAVVYAEDTRRTAVLFRRFDIGTSLRSLHSHNEASRCDEILELLAAGQACALVTDAGAPGVSDPGARLVRSVSDAGFEVRTIPGPSAVTAAAGLSGFPVDRFLFLGFPPRKGRERAQWLGQCAGSKETVIVFEAPGRLASLLDDWVTRGLGDRACCVCRELTKLHEEVRRGTVAALAEYYGREQVRGEVTLVLEAALDSEAERPDFEAARHRAAALFRDGHGARAVSAALREEFGLSRNDAYAVALAAGGEEGEGR
jgi:16S rRNA (cytidine1402-2'-O)-methyltransferase